MVYCLLEVVEVVSLFEAARFAISEAVLEYQPQMNFGIADPPMALGLFYLTMEMAEKESQCHQMAPSAHLPTMAAAEVPRRLTDHQ